MEEKLKQLEIKLSQIEKKYLFSKHKRWVCNYTDVGPCDFCKQLEGTDVPWGQWWSQDGYEGLKPGSVHENCGCSYIIVYK